MKTMLAALFIILTSVCFAFGDEVDNQLPSQATVHVRTSTRQMIQAGIDMEETIRITRLMVQNQFTEREVLRVHQMIMNAKGRGLPVGPLMDKVFEGMAKQVQARNIIQAIETVQNRYNIAHNYAIKITGQKTSRELVRNALANGFAAGLKEKDVQAITEALQQRARTENMVAARLGTLAAETFTTARDMARMGVSSEAIGEVIFQAIRHGYSDKDMNTLGKSFMNQTRQVAPNTLAARYIVEIRGGVTAEGLGSSSMEGGSAGQGGFGHGSGSGGSGGGGDGGHR